MRIFLKSKSISPLLAGFLLVALTVSISFLVVSNLITLTQKQTRTTQTQSTSCLYVNLDIVSMECKSSGNFSVSNQSWWNSSFPYRKEITIQENSGNNLTDYQVFLNISYSPHMQEDFDDLRFTYKNSTGEYEIPYWIENYTSSKFAEVWIKVPYIQANSNATVYMYYGNSQALSKSNGTTTLLIYDEFTNNANNWNCYATSCCVIDGVYSIYKSSAGGSEWANYTTKIPFYTISEVKVRLGNSTTDGYNANFGFKIGSSSKGGASIYVDEDKLDRVYNGTAKKDVSNSRTENTWYVFILKINSSHITLGNIGKTHLTLGNEIVSILNTRENELYDFCLGVGADAYGVDVAEYDYVLVRRITDPEPTYSLGQEQSYSNQGNQSQLASSNYTLSITLFNPSSTSLKGIELSVKTSNKNIYMNRSQSIEIPPNSYGEISIQLPQNDKTISKIRISSLSCPIYIERTLGLPECR